MDRILPWGLQLLLIYGVPQIVPTANKLTVIRNPRSKKPRIFRDKKAQIFRDHIKAATWQLLGELKKKNPAIEDIKFPITGSECQLRCDVLFGFAQFGRGPDRMVRSDLDNLKKGVFDGLEGALIDDDRWIVEGYAAKGKAPPGAKGDTILIVVSRAAFRDARALELLAQLPIFPPWRAEDQSKIIRPDLKKTLTN